MSDIFNRQANAEILERLSKLTQDSKPLWGKMTVAQMLWHCQKPLEVTTGKLPLQGGLRGFLFGKMAKNSFLKNKGFSKNSPTHPKFKMVGTPDFETEKQALINSVTAFGQTGTGIIAIQKHPFFGPMSEQEWGALHYIHLDHHLKQFGL